MSGCDKEGLHYDQIRKQIKRMYGQPNLDKTTSKLVNCFDSPDVVTKNQYRGIPSQDPKFLEGLSPEDQAMADQLYNL